MFHTARVTELAKSLAGGIVKRYTPTVNQDNDFVAPSNEAVVASICTGRLVRPRRDCR
jgi:hypothetical protein